MSIHFYPLRIKKINKETDQCVSVEFEIPESLSNSFQFKQGQSLTMRTNLAGEEVRRTYSLCSSPLDKKWKVAIKKVEGGLFSSFANEDLKEGDELDVMEPVGKFYTELNPTNKKKYLAFAAGSGITPVISIIKTTLRTEPQRTETPINFGRIDIGKLTELEKLIDYKKMDEIFICGPEEMIFCVKNFLEQKDISEKKIHFELFTTSGQKKKSGVGSQESGVKEGPQSKITVKVDGRSFDFDLSLNSDITILDAALKEGADLPFACKGGMCCTCKAKLTEGEVEMDVHWGLEHEEVEQGYILTCQSHPKTEKVIVDFDIK